uniref:Uncharacterized protein n=1 Tax=Rhizophora mucronata TaxID=61149 RepID=A0A2P2QZ74_RHIMU
MLFLCRWSGVLEGREGAQLDQRLPMETFPAIAGGMS